MLHLAESCSILDVSEGMLAGRQCPLEHKLGPKKDIYLGGEIFKLKVIWTCNCCRIIICLEIIHTCILRNIVENGEMCCNYHGVMRYAIKQTVTHAITGTCRQQMSLVPCLRRCPIHRRARWQPQPRIFDHRQA